MQFQYLSLIRYSKNITAAYKQAIKISSKADAKLRDMEGIASAEHGKVHSLEQKAQKLRRLEARLPAIEHYLSIIPRLAEYVLHHYHH